MDPQILGLIQQTRWPLQSPESDVLAALKTSDFRTINRIAQDKRLDGMPLDCWSLGEAYSAALTLDTAAFTDTMTQLRCSARARFAGSWLLQELDQIEAGSGAGPMAADPLQSSLRS